ncbi:MAG TPA: xanthine dehydrogenase family protein molybdopterin-binding subunit [Micropepsaceae bacterium]|nr:xanthine dehydrogenase family protein molybdopterin-binding subunit [Micropepsaceae bacterium]
MSGKSIGARVLRTEDARFLTGRGEFVDDIQLPNMLHAAFVRASFAHARVRGVDASVALGLDGVHAVFTAADMSPAMQTTRLPMLVPNPYSKISRTQFALAQNEVCYVGEPIAVVVADSRHLAEDAAAAVVIDYEPLPAASDCRDAVKLGAAPAHLGAPDNKAAMFKVAYGDVASAFASAAHIFREELWHHRGCGHAMECRGVVAEFAAHRGGLTVWSSTQTPHLEKRALAELLEMNSETVRVIAPDVGGGFGPKAIFYGEEAVVAAAAMRLKRPVKWIEDRREHFLSTTQERDQYWSLEIALDSGGKLLGVRGTMLHDTGAYLPWGVVMPYIAATTVPGPYVLPAYELEVTVAYTNKVPTTPVRGAGRPQAVFAMERLMDRAAKELRLDPAEIRRRNLIAPSQMPYPVGLMFRDGKPVVYDSGDYPAAFDKALALSDYRDFPRRQKEARADGRYIGIGIGSYVEGTGLGPFEGVTVRVLDDGRIAVQSGAAPQGQGHKTMLQQVVAQELGVAMHDVVVTLGDTAAIAMGVGTFASRITANAAPSALLASQAVRNKMLELAARALGAEVTDLQLDNSKVEVKSGNRRAIGFGELAKMAQGFPGFSFAPGQIPGLEHTAYFTPAQAAYCNGTHVVEVEMDIETGAVRILNYAVAHDSGNLINPLIVDGQIQGGVAHGIGNALLEFMAYDSNAQPLTVSFAEYLLPGACDVPNINAVHLETPSPLNPLGVKGAGEGGTIPAAAAIIAAIENALSPFGVKLTESPITPARIIAQLRSR